MLYLSLQEFVVHVIYEKKKDSIENQIDIFCLWDSIIRMNLLFYKNEIHFVILF